MVAAATTSPATLNLYWLAVLYPVWATPEPVPDTPVPIEGVVLAIRLIPNCLLSIVEPAAAAIAVMVLPPDVNVVPL